MKSAWMLAHERLMATLPVRTHLQESRPPPEFKKPRKERSWRRDEIRRMLAAGLDIPAMMKRLKVSRPAIRYHLDAIKEEGQAAG